MIPSLLQMAQWSLIDSYAPIPPNTFDDILTSKDVTICIKYLPGATVIIFPGSEKLEDWFDDFEAVPYEHRQLGILHWGFWKAAPDIYAVVHPLIRGDLYLGGHSLGGAHAANVAACFGLNGIRTKGLYLFESPRPGCAKMAAFIQNTVDLYFSCQNGPDPVPYLPSFPFRPVVPITPVLSHPQGVWDIVPTEYHRGAVVLEAVKEYLSTKPGDPATTVS